MPGRVRSVSSHRRHLLATGWEMCSTQPGAFDHSIVSSDERVEWLPIGKPTTAAAGLRALGKWSLNDTARRFDAEDWWFRARFETPRCEAGEHLVLGFDGIATVADVWLDGRHVLASDNMFLAHECAVDANVAEHELLIRCRSLDALLTQKRPRPRWRTPMIDNQQLRWFRTTLLGRTPGWSPAAAAVGPWKDVWLERRSVVEINDLRLQCSLEHGRGIVNVTVDARALDGTIDGCVLALQGPAMTHRTTLTRAPSGELAGHLEIEQPERWWPHTHGNPVTYPATLQFACGSRTVEADLGRIAFREIELNTADGDFAVSVNGVRVFCRGACWTPLDSVTLRSDEAATSNAISQVVDAGMNMLRVGGTMVYEDDTFLDECDRRGILLWQDFMFANMDYPAGDDVFDASVRREVVQQLARLQARPCVALLCGNSEGAQQAAMWGAGRELWQPPLFHTTLPALCKEFGNAAYWPSSAFGGSFPHQPNCGTTSYYGVGAYQRPLEDARRSGVRFASECLAFANIPEPSTIAVMPGGYGLRVHHPAWKAATPRDLGAGWDFEDVRDHYLRLLFDVDPASLRYADHDRYLELSRVASAEAMAASFAEWRRGESQCRGALVWFLRDFIAGAGWGIVDALGQPKATYYALRRTLQPRAALFSDEGVNGPFVHLLNETGAAVTAEATLTAYKRSVTVATATQTVTLPARSAVARSALEWFDGFRDFSWSYRFGPPSADLLVVTLNNDAEGVIHQDFHFPLGRPCTADVDSGLTAKAQSMTADEYRLLVATERFAQHVHVEVDGFDVSDQYFHLAPGGQRTVLLRRRADQPKRDLRGAVRTLNSRETARIIIE